MGTNMQDIQFLSTLSLRRATGCVAGNWPRGIFLSTLSLRRATLADFRKGIGCTISIHALLAESDTQGPQSAQQNTAISIHALLAESDLIEDEALVKEMQISIHALLAESDTYFIEHLPDIVISIHALLAESDLNEITYFDLDNDFYPRSPCGERRRCNCFRAYNCGNFYPRSPCGERRYCNKIFAGG